MSADARIAQIHEREAKATKGPWVWEWPPDPYPVEREVSVMASPTVTVAFVSRVPPDFRRYDSKPHASTVTQGDRDAAFIAHGREDIPYLLDLVASLTKARDEAQQQLAAMRERFRELLACRGIVDEVAEVTSDQWDALLKKPASPSEA